MVYRLPEPYYFDQGSVGVVLLHAYTGSANDVRMLGRFLEKQQISVLAPQLSGHATFEPLDILAVESLSIWWQDTKSAIQQLQRRHKQPLFVFGLSLGGLFALRALECLPEVTGGGIFSTPVLEDPTEQLMPLFQQYARKVYQIQALTPAQSAPRLQEIRQKLPRQLEQIKQFSQLVQADFKQIGTKPVFIGQGAQDQVINPQQALTLKQQLELLKIPVETHWYPDGGHVITVDPAHHQLETDVLAFIKRFDNKKEVLM